MLHHAPASQPLTDVNLVRIGVGIDTSRYGHYAVFLRDDLKFSEAADGYAQLRSRLEQIVTKLGTVHFAVRLDVAGQYADNLLHFLHSLPAQLASAAFTISCGDPKRNKDYRAALFGAKKSDPVEARAAAHYALRNPSTSVKMLPAEMRSLRQVASRLQAIVRQRTRLTNQLHLLLARTFPELALLVNDIASGWVLTLCERYPTAKLLAVALSRPTRAVATAAVVATATAALSRPMRCRDCAVRARAVVAAVTYRDRDRRALPRPLDSVLTQPPG